MVRGLVALFALGCSLLVAVADAGAGVPKNYTPADVAGVFRGVGIGLEVSTVSGNGPGTYTWLRSRMSCRDTDDSACVAKMAKARRLLVAVCPSARTAARVASAMPKTWQTTAVRNVVVAYQITFEPRPPNVGLAVSRLAASSA